jgi:NADPH-dependent glutamate synthase beta subunit-like oxidoreductase
MENEILVENADLIPAVEKLLDEKARLSTASCIDLGDKFEIIYHFEPQESPEPLTHIRVTIAKEDTLPSISNIYLCAALIENEIQELFNVQISGIALDFQKRFLRSKESPEAELLKPAPYVPEPPVRIPVRCGEACPAGIDIPRYVRLIGEGKFAEALAVIKQSLPFPGILGRVCFAPCEGACRQGKQWEPIANRMLKRFAYDHATYEEKGTAKRTGKRVAIIGSGPAGLTAAYYLAKIGHGVTIFEALPQAGGMMRVGIPSYRLPRKILDDEIEIVKNLGVEIKTNAKVEALDSLFKDGYQAVFVATGAYQGVKMGVGGEEHPKVMECIDFLRDVNFGKPVKLGERVAVIGGGNAAIDSARTALRLGAKEVTIFYRRSRAEMPASPSEVEEAIKEGVKIHILAAPVRIRSKDGQLTGIEFTRMELGEPDASGRRRPIPIKGSEFIMEVDNVIIAIGQVVDKTALPPELEYTGLGTIVVDPTTLQTNIEGVFAGGDVVSGPSDVIAAVAGGKEAAISIDKYLGGEGVLPVEEIKVKEPTSRYTYLERWQEKREVEVSIVDGSVSVSVEKKRAEMPTLPLEKRLGGFDEVELGLTQEMAIAEGQRCWRCDLEE